VCSTPRRTEGGGCSSFPFGEFEVRGRIAHETLRKQRAVLLILLAACERALEAFQVADNVADDQFVVELERVIARTKRELQALNERLAAQAAH
jgi:hypothetical protein